jgi:hypothetical protein
MIIGQESVSCRIIFKLSHHFRNSLVNFQLPILAWEKFLRIEPRVYAVFFQAGVESAHLMISEVRDACCSS